MPVDRDTDANSLATSSLSFISTGSVESTDTLMADEPPPYSSIYPSQQWTSQDSTSTLTLAPSYSTNSSSSDRGRRKLLLIYIHGFMGNETSFQNFPADVHNLLTALLDQSHSVHSKIYPRYRSKKAIQVATNDFSKWLEPHESPTTDVILLGHSLGGILAAEVALLPSDNPSSTQPSRHNLVGTISFDTPFLGMHPGVIKSGLGSIFYPSPAPTSTQSSHTDVQQDPERTSAGQQSMNTIVSFANTLFPTQSPDPNFNPAFPNDVRLPLRSGWANAFHFVQKHAQDLRQATTQLVASHLEFGGCLADMDGLKIRYVKIRLLEEEAAEKRKSVFEGKKCPPRVRFINYYTASTGRIKPPKIKSPNPSVADLDQTDKNVLNEAKDISSVVEATSPESKPKPSEDDSASLDELRDMDPVPEVDSDDENELDDGKLDRSNSDTTSSHSTITPFSTRKLDIPGIPNRPPPPILPLSDKVAYVRVLLDYERDLKNYRQALKTYRKTHCHLIKEERKSSKLCPTNMLDRSKTKDKTSTLEMRNLNQELPQNNSELSLSLSSRDAETAKQQQLQTDLETQESDVEAAEHKIARLLEKAQAKGEKSQRKMEKEIEKAERKIIKHVDKADRKAEKDREKAERKVTKEFEKSERKLAKEAEKLDKKANKLRSSTSNDGTGSTGDSANDLEPKISNISSKIIPEDGPTATTDNPTKPKKDKKFCLLPPKDSHGNRDPCWARVYMQGVDEVGAHCGLFFPWQPGELGEGQDGSKGSSERYAGLVAGVAEKVEEWIGEKATERLVTA